MGKILNIYHVPVPVRANAKGAAFLAVLTEGAANDQAVYIGICGDMDVNAPNYEATRFAAAHWVMCYGQKLTYRKALVYFPNLARSFYRD